LGVEVFALVNLRQQLDGIGTQTRHIGRSRREHILVPVQRGEIDHKEFS
jgi:hypothetical protein